MNLCPFCGRVMVEDGALATSVTLSCLVCDEGVDPKVADDWLDGFPPVPPEPNPYDLPLDWGWP